LRRRCGMPVKPLATRCSAFWWRPRCAHPQGRPPFAFKLHQFISGPGKVLATLEAPGKCAMSRSTRSASRRGGRPRGQAVPGALLPRLRAGVPPRLAVRRARSSSSIPGKSTISADDNEDASYGFLCPVPGAGLPGRAGRPARNLARPQRVANPKSSQPTRMPFPIWSRSMPKGKRARRGVLVHSGKFRFCLNCGHTRSPRQGHANRLASLSGEGRSSATTILTLRPCATVRGHRVAPGPARPAQAAWVSPTTARMPRCRRGISTTSFSCSRCVPA
jgi:hypothetical protein